MGQDGHIQKFTTEDQNRMLRNIIEPMASDGLRTLSIAYKDYVQSKPGTNDILYEGEPDWEDEGAIISDLTCISIVGIEDPVRPEVRSILISIQFSPFHHASQGNSK